MRYGFGVDLGGTACKLGLFMENGDLVCKWETGTNRADQGSHILDDIAAEVQREADARGLAREDILGIGLGVPGPVVKGGLVKGCVNLGWGELPVEQILSEKTGLPVKTGNDANVAAMGEVWKGSGEGCANLMLITLGTGVGGGIVVNGEILPGLDGAGGEIGHVLVNPHEKNACNCGRKGCLEQYVSATGIVRMAEQTLETEPDCKTVLRKGSVTARDVFDAARNGDELAGRVTARTGKILGRTLANLAVVLNPEMFLIGGGVSKAGGVLLEAVRRGFEAEVFEGCRDTRIELASLGNDAGMYGAMRLIL